MKQTDKAITCKSLGHFVYATFGGFGCVLALAVGQAWAAPQPVQPGTQASSPQQDSQVTQPIAPLTVLAMIKAENDVLAQYQAAQTKVAARARPKPALLSIYGVLPQLRATVLVNGHEVVFEQGRKQPLHPQMSGLRLRHITPPCVSFTQNAMPQTVCLSRVGS